MIYNGCAASDVDNGSEEYKMMIVEQSGREVNLQADNSVDKKLWFEGIKLHIQYYSN